MTTAPPEPVGAVSHEREGWHAINWQAVHKNVRRLQARIVKATKAGEFAVSKPRPSRGVSPA